MPSGTNHYGELATAAIAIAAGVTTTAATGGSNLVAAGAIAGVSQGLMLSVAEFQKRMNRSERALKQRTENSVRAAVATLAVTREDADNGAAHALDLVQKYGLTKFRIGELEHNADKCADEVLSRAASSDPQGWSSPEGFYEVTRVAIRTTYQVLCADLADGNDVLGAIAARQATLKELVEAVLEELRELTAAGAERAGEAAGAAAEAAERTAARDATLRWVAAIAQAKGFQVQARKMFPVWVSSRGGFDGPATLDDTNLCELVILDGTRRATVVPVSMTMEKYLELSRNPQRDGPWLTQIGVGTDLVTLESPGMSSSGRLIVPGADVTQPIIERTIETALNNSALPR